ncbi:zinc finger, CCHC-type containing protein [Tanacetum coccineum]
MDVKQHWRFYLRIWKLERKIREATALLGGLDQARDFVHDKVLGQQVVPEEEVCLYIYIRLDVRFTCIIDDFNKIVLDLSNLLRFKIEDEDLALLLLTSIQHHTKHFVDTLLYGREALTLEDVMATLNSKEIKERSKAKGDDGEGLYVRGRTDRRDSRQSKGKSRSKSRGGRLKCYICQSDDHLKRNCPKNNRKKSTSYARKMRQPSLAGCSYHMTPMLDILFDFLECDRGSVQLGDNRECKIRGIGKVRLQLKDGSSFVLHNVRYIPELKRNLISLGTLEKEGYTVKMQSGKHAMVTLSLIASVEERKTVCAGLPKDGTYLRGGIQCFCWKRVGLVWQEKSRTLMDKVRCLLIQSGLPKTFWAEATCTAAYLINRSPSTAIEKKTPMEMWSGHPSDYGMLRIFGCVAYPHNKQVTSRNVVFNESVMYKDTLKDSGAGDKSVEELQVEVELQRFNNHTPEEDHR